MDPKKAKCYLCVIKLLDSKVLRGRLCKQEAGDGFCDIPAQLGTYEAFIKYLRELMQTSADSSLQAKIIARLIHRIEVNTTGVKIHYYVGQEHFERELAAVAGIQPSENDHSSFLRCIGSNSLTSGARETGVDEPAPAPNFTRRSTVVDFYFDEIHEGKELTPTDLAALVHQHGGSIRKAANVARMSESFVCQNMSPNQ